MTQHPPNSVVLCRYIKCAFKDVAVHCCLLTHQGEKKITWRNGEVKITLIVGLQWFPPTTEQDPCYFLKPFRSCNTVMVHILVPFKWTQDQISQLTCFRNNTENSPRHTEPFPIKFISSSIHFALYPHFTDSYTKPHLSSSSPP